MFSNWFTKDYNKILQQSQQVQDVKHKTYLFFLMFGFVI